VTVERPLPTPNADTRPFWEGCARGELLFQSCSSCHRAQFYPRRFCTYCHSESLTWRASARKGTVASHTTVFRAPSPAFKQMCPYVIALIDLDEGFRMMVNIVGSDPGKIAIGRRVRIIFQQVDTISLPQGEIEE
jgi:uncharacterized protein